jgi:hypothetical protein
MKRKFIPLFVLFVLLLSSFVQKEKRKKNKHLPKYFVEIPGGYLWDQLHSNGLNIWVNPNPFKDSTETFYISETEVTNQQYERYLYNHHVVGEQNIYKDDKSKQYMVVPRHSLTSDKIGDTRLITAEVKSYWPNKFGTYNMCGNGAELILEDSIALGGSWNDPRFDIRIESEKPATKRSSLIGFRVIAYINLH